MLERTFEAPTALIVAHPGHELLLHHFIERFRPVVFALTDGSGGHGEDRCAFSRQAIEAAGGRTGEVFGADPDRSWYQDILDGRLGRFLEARDAIAGACRAAGVSRVVADPIELFNPMHDLCAVLAAAVARELEEDFGAAVPTFDYPIEAERPDRPGDVLLALDAIALERKLRAARRYAPLTEEVEARAAAPALAIERLRPARALAAWPERLAREPFYESFGRKRLEQHAYRKLITYAGHVRPIALALGAGAPETGASKCASPQSSPSETSGPISAIASAT